MLAGCGGPQSPIGAPGTMPQSTAIATHFDITSASGGSAPAGDASLRAEDRRDGPQNASWMEPDAGKRGLLYVTDVRTVTVYSYPQGKLEGQLKGFYVAVGECVDKKGDVFIADEGYDKIFEYAHGGKKRLATLDSASRDPNSCAIDPTTGNLAVASLGGSSGSVAVYKNAHGKQTTYQDAAFKQYWLCGYDDRGNLFVDGQNNQSDFVFAELPKRATKLKIITLNQAIGWPGGVQWDGKHIAVGDQNTPVLYRFSIRGSRGRKVGTTSLGSGASVIDQFFIDAKTLIAPNQLVGSNSDVLFYKYPAGGTATKIITKAVRAAHGVVVSAN